MKSRTREPLPNRPNAGAYFFVATLIALSAWVEQHRIAVSPVASATKPSAQRAPASSAEIEEEIAINPTGKAPGTFTVSVRFSRVLAPKLKFADVVDFYAGVEVSNAMTALLAERKSPPLNLLRSELSVHRSGPTTYYVVTGWAKGLKMFTSHRSRMKCTEEGSDRAWKQRCELDTEFEGSTKYLAAYRQDTTCAEKDGTLECRIDYLGDAEAVDVPKLAQLLFNASSYTKNQAAFKMAESLLIGTYAQIALLGYPAPLVENAEEAINEYFKSGVGQSTIRQLSGQFPKYEDAPKSYRQ
jgi:hypothetical protein